jgi:mRNA interferase RelE/StbE
VILAWRIELTATATKQLAKLDKGEAKRISAFLRQRLATREQDLRKAHPARRIGDDSTDVRLADHNDAGAFCVSPVQDPRSTGKALVGPALGSYWRYRLGDYRIICDIQDDAVCNLVIELGNRREIYR